MLLLVRAFSLLHMNGSQRCQSLFILSCSINDVTSCVTRKQQGPWYWFCSGRESTTLAGLVYETGLPGHKPTGPVAARTHQLGGAHLPGLRGGNTGPPNRLPWAGKEATGPQQGQADMEPREIPTETTAPSLWACYWLSTWQMSHCRLTTSSRPGLALPRVSNGKPELKELKQHVQGHLAGREPNQTPTESKSSE